MGIDTLQEKWQRLTGLETTILTDEYLQGEYGEVVPGEYLLVAADLLPDLNTVARILKLAPGEGMVDQKGLLAARLILETQPVFDQDFLSMVNNPAFFLDGRRIEKPSDLFCWNDAMIRQDFKHFAACGSLAKSSPGVQLVNPREIYIDETATVEHSIINATYGPVYIGKNATVMEGCLIRGPFVLGEGAVLKMGTKVYGATTLGPHCVGGGEIKNSIMMGYSNKGHDGYLGDSVIGEWCNLGAGTSNSNLKNNVGDVKVWSYYTNNYVASGTKCGVVMGDYSRSAINTSFNTGTVVGVCCNVFGEGLSPSFIPDFTWGTKGSGRYELEKGIKDITSWMKLKNCYPGEQKIKMLRHIFDHYLD